MLSFLQKQRLKIFWVGVIPSGLAHGLSSFLLLQISGGLSKWNGQCICKMHAWHTHIPPQLVGPGLIIHPTRSLLPQPEEPANPKPDT